MPALKYTHICVFGDSIAYGYGDTEKGGWVNRLKIELFSKNKFTEVLDVSVPGDTSRRLLDRFAREVSVRRADIVIFAIGINDSQYRSTPENFLVPMAEFEQNLRKLVSQARQFTQKIVLVGLSPVDEAKTRPIFTVTRTHYTNQNAAKYDAVVQKVAQGEGLPYVSVFGLLATADLPDGLHIAASGHAKIYLKVEQALLQNWPDLLT